MYAKIWYMFPMSCDEYGDMLYETHTWECRDKEEFAYAMNVLSQDDILKIEY